MFTANARKVTRNRNHTEGGETVAFTCTSLWPARSTETGV